MATVREACCKFLMRQLHPTNCLGIRSFAGKNLIIVKMIIDYVIKYKMNTRNLLLKYVCLVFSDTHACKELHKRSHKFALQNFQEVMNTEEFLLLPFQEVMFLDSSLS